MPKIDVLTPLKLGRPVAVTQKRAEQLKAELSPLNQKLVKETYYPGMVVLQIPTKREEPNDTSL